MKILGIAGSLRQGSYNKALLRAAQGLAPEGMEIERFDLSEVPLYNGDLDNDVMCPVSVVRLRREIEEADGLLIVTPEYNHSIPGVLQNALDWASRPAMRSPLAGKPVVVMGATPGGFGTVRAQSQLKVVLLSTLARVMPHAGVAVAFTRGKFDYDGNLVDEKTREHVAGMLTAFAEWTQTFDVHDTLVV